MAAANSRGVCELGLLPALFFEQAQHFRVFERRERGSEVAGAARAQAPARQGVAQHGAPAQQKSSSATRNSENAGQEIRRGFDPPVEDHDFPQR